MLKLAELMTLHVPFEQFPKTVAHFLATKEAFVNPHGFGSLITAAHPEKQFLIVSYTDHTPAATKTKLTQLGLDAFDGAWRLSDEIVTEEGNLEEAFVTAIAYKSADSVPGVWVDAHPVMPTQVQALRAMYDEFRETGELSDVSFEEFVRLSEPNVVIVTPHEIQSFLAKKSEP